MANTVDLIKQSAEIAALAETLKASGQTEEDAYRAAWILITGKLMPGTEQVPPPTSNNNNMLYAILGIEIVAVLIIVMKGKHV
jgi:hypothetical protein